ncbi:hypothetical protein OIDMADRAFT_184186 [Oidiodendron maius Zn]|uniref:ShKT domain-containing protein n=1 Tax=Oidiodendron maius (strain Zn) TaxID=913774 RepID=A0A0C3C878_OIDMZ|nr:hypothetical protein OIDMADRAFT_184186 [Oidiodendron maius Zn]
MKIQLIALAAFVTMVVAAPLTETPGLGSKRKALHKRDDGVLADLMEPVVDGVANPLTAGLGRGVAGAAAGTQQPADLLGDAGDTLLHTLGGIAGNTEQGAGVAVANAAPAVQAPDVEHIQSRCTAFHENKPCKEEQQKVTYLSSKCGKDCPGWEDAEDAYKEEYKREVADNFLYYGNKDASQEDIFLEKDDCTPKKPQFILPSYQALSPTKFMSSRISKSTPGPADPNHSLSSSVTSEPASPASKSPTSPKSTFDSVENEVHHPFAVYTSRHEPWKKRQPKGHGKTIKYESDSEEE